MDTVDLSYVRLAHGRVKTSMQLADDVVADYDAKGTALGVEFLSAAARAREDEYIMLARSDATRERLLSDA